MIPSNKELQYKIYKAIDQYALAEVFRLMKTVGVDAEVINSLSEQTIALRKTMIAVKNEAFKHPKQDKDKILDRKNNL